MTLFLLKFFITNIVFSFILCSAFIRLDKSDRYSRSELLLYFLGLGPAFTTLLLYYSFFVFKHHSNIFYFILIAAVYFLMAVIGRKSFKHIFGDVKKNVKKVFIVKDLALGKIEHIILMVIICVPLAVYLFFYLTKILPQPLIGHDILNYGITGRMLFDEKSLAPVWITNFSKSGYIYGALHAPSFSLLLTWEELVNSFFHASSDLYFKSISTYYGLLILSVQYYWVSRINRWLAVLAALALVSGLLFFTKFLFPHIDTYRIFFFIMSLVYLVYAVKKPDYLSVILFGIFSGFAAFAHRIGVVTTAISCITFIVMMDYNFKSRVIKAAIVIMLILAFGGDHYIFDLIWGRGAWIH